MWTWDCMTAGSTSSFPLRFLSRRRNPAVLRAHVPLHVHHSKSPLYLSPVTMSMFKRANATFEAKNSKAPQPQVSLAQQLFPSSSPTPKPDINIKEQFQRRPATAFMSSRLSQPSNSKAAVETRRSTPAQPLKQIHSVNRPGLQSGRQFASLYNSGANSFREEPDVIDLTDAKGTKSIANVDFFEDDFSDDENLDLDYQCPSALPPTLPTTATQATKLVAKKDVEAVIDDNTSMMSWSQSSPSHMQPARSVSVSQSTNSTTSTKRPASRDNSVVEQPAVKKRIAPVQYQKYKTAQASTATMGHSTPAAKPKPKKEPHTWDLTPGALKAQQKKLKEKVKKSTAAGSEVSREDAQQAVKSQNAKQSVISLSHEQEVVKELVCDGNKSVFFTGPAGTGKSVLMRAIIAQLKKKYARDPERLAVTASTGLAACNIGGMTLHSFSGIGLGKDDVATLVKKIRRNPKAKNRWLRTKVLVIDEISMVDGDLFDKLSQIGRTLRNNGRPWGGIQLVITGDFFQLPPVPDRDSREAKFAFDAATWSTSIDHTIGLTEVFRQKDPGRT